MAVISIFPNVSNAMQWSLVVALVMSACTTRDRGNGEDSESDDTIDDGGTDLPWESDTDTDFIVLEPVFLSQLFGIMSASFNGSHVAVSFSDKVLDESRQTEYSTVFLSFPWESPEDVMENAFVENNSTCDGPYNILMAVSKPHSNSNGSVLLTASSSDDFSDCEVVLTSWDNEANLILGPISFSNLFPPGDHRSMNPFGETAPTGTITTGNLQGIGFNSGSDSVQLILDVDQWESDGTHSRLTHAVFDWPDSPDDHDSVQCNMNENVFTHDGLTAVLASGYDGVSTPVILSTIDEAGAVVQSPIVVLNVPLAPPAFDGKTASAYYSFAGFGNVILALAKVHYLDPANSGYDPSIEEPFPIALWTSMISLDGNVIHDWDQIVFYNSHVQANQARLAWSGRYFAACYNDPFDTFKVVIMDETGNPVADPIDLFWSIPPVENRNLPCDIVAIDEDTFVAVLGVYTEPPQPYPNGLWATRVDVNIVE